PREVFGLHDPWSATSILLIILGVTLRGWAASILDKSQKLATEGPYSFCRHPLYLGSFLMLLGFLVLINNPWCIAIILSVIVATYPSTIAYEESLMAQLFGDEWTVYRGRVGLLIPRGRVGLGPVSLDRWM